MTDCHTRLSASHLAGAENGVTAEERVLTHAWLPIRRLQLDDGKFINEVQTPVYRLQGQPLILPTQKEKNVHCRSVYMLIMNNVVQFEAMHSSSYLSCSGMSEGLKPVPGSTGYKSGQDTSQSQGFNLRL